MIIIPNPESIRMQLFGFWRDPEHVRFYHPELIEGVVRHYGLEIVYSNRHEEPFALEAPTCQPAESPTSAASAASLGQWRSVVRRSYTWLLRTLRLTSRADLAALQIELRNERAVFEKTMLAWAGQATWAANRMWAWPDNALIVCRKPE